MEGASDLTPDQRRSIVKKLVIRERMLETDRENERQMRSRKKGLQDRVINGYSESTYYRPWLVNLEVPSEGVRRPLDCELRIPGSLGSRKSSHVED